MNGESNQNQQSSEQNNFWSRHSKAIIRLIIIAVIIVGAVIYAQTQPTQNQIATVDESNGSEDTENGDGNEVEVTDRTDDGTEVSVIQDERPGETIRVTGQEITVVVQKGNGYTHTARRALAQYLEANNNSELEAEHKIYVEDYLQKRIAEKKRLFVGDEVSFEQGEIEGAIEAALDLTDSQVENLSKYVPLVPGLM